MSDSYLGGPNNGPTYDEQKDGSNSYQSGPSSYYNNSGYGGIEHPNNMAVLILGIIGFFVPLASFFGVFIGFKIKKEMKEAPNRYRESSVFIIGWILSVVGAAIQAVSMFFVILLIVGIMSVNI